MRNPRFWIGLALSVVCLYIAFRGIDLIALSAALTHANYVYLIPAVGLVVVTLVLRAYRWGMLFYPDRPPRLGRLFSALSIGYLISTILPARLGDVVRAALVGEGKGPKFAQALSTVVVERLLDMFSIIVILLVLLPYVDLSPVIERSALTIAAALVAAFVILIIASWQRVRAVALLRLVLLRVPRLNADVWAKRFAGLLDGLSVLRAPVQLLKVALMSLVIWGVGGVLFNYLALRAFNLDATLAQPWSGLAAAAFVQVVVALGAAVPSSPGYVGVYHASVILALSAFGVPQTEALAFALVSHAVNFGALIVIGAVCLWREGLSLDQLIGSRKAGVGAADGAATGNAATVGPPAVAPSDSTQG
ncbi:MAG: lysylphosphatidylglycerol synthase transmembrane domain-containing protein [Anaerolineae bacterium]